MANLNKIFLIGRLTRDPELRYTPGGAAVTDLGIATNRTYQTKEGESREEALFVDVTVWNRQAENCCQFLKKGRQVHVEGFLKMDSWDDKTTGEKRTKLKVEAERVQFLDGRREEGGESDLNAPAPAAGRNEPRRSAEARPSNGPAPRGFPPAGSSPRRPAAPQSAPESEDDEDIPF